MRLHLDTDFGGDPDDAAALVMLLGMAEVDLVGITTNLEHDGRRAGCVHHYLYLAGRPDVPVAAGAPSPGELKDRYRSTWGDPDFWPDPVEPAPGRVDDALDLLDASIDGGAVICTIGALTNLALVEERSPGRLRGVPVVTMGGWVDPFDDDLPPWGPERDFNVQVDRVASETVLRAGAELTLVQLPTAARAQLRGRDLDRLRGAGPVGELLARQSLAHRDKVDHAALAAEYNGLADDLVNFHWDPVTAAIATGWPGASIATRRLRSFTDAAGVVRTVEDPDGREVRVVDRVDGDAFAGWWLATIEQASSNSTRPTSHHLAYHRMRRGERWTGSDHVADQSVQAATAFKDGSWATAYRLLADANERDLTTVDLERLAVAAYLLGRDEDAVAAWERGYRRHLDADDRSEAGRFAFWAALCSMLRGQMAHAGGWLSRAEATINGLDCPAAGYLLMTQLLGALDAGEPDTARDLARQAGEIADRFSDPDLRAFATLGHGQALLALGEQTAGLALLDDVMLSVSSGEVGPITTGIVYCAVILECMQIFDLARAAEWTRALDDWCSAQPDLVPYRGQCLVHQSQMQQAAGQWSRAVSTASSACDRLSDPPHPALGLAYYQEAELCRLRGEYDDAADAYARASRAGHQPMPGLALLDRARDAVDDAAAGIRRALGEITQPFQRPGLLAAAVEIFSAAGDVEEAGAASAELVEIAEQSPSEMLTGIAQHWAGAVLLASGETSDALVQLRAAAAIWQRLNLQYEAARTAVLLGRACLALDDRKSAELEFDNARETFTSLGAATDLAELGTLTGASRPGSVVLSKRELEVLDHVVEGKTNVEIAAALSISRHTVGRHLENIFAKLGVNSRAALTAYAYEHDLL